MRLFRAALTALALLLMSLVVAGPASAGGPTSVLLVEPDTRTAASLYYSDAEYQELADLVGAFDGSDTGTGESPGPRHEPGAGITATWLIHDVQVWRVDRIHLGAKGGPWISTQTSVDGSGNLWDSPPVWRTANDGKALTTLLDRVGLGPDPDASVGGDGTGVTGGTGGAAEPAPAAEARPAASQPADTEPGGLGGIVWGLAGLALGVALTMVVVRLLPTGSATVGAVTPAPAMDDDFDLEPSVESEDARDWSIPDELSSTTR